MTATTERLNCPICGRPGRGALEARDRNREITGERFWYARCEGCGTLFIMDVPGDLARYYELDYYAFGPDGEPSWRSTPHRLEAESYRADLLLRHVSPGHLIEVGSGTGGFAAAARAAGFDVSAIEMSERCCEYLREAIGVRTLCSDRPLEAIGSLPAARAVALWHVLEHLPSPSEVLERSIGQLEHGGVLAIAVPNPVSLQARLLRSRWAHLDAPRHLQLIPPDTIVKKAESLGMRCVEMTAKDPDGLECNLFGWLGALRRRPAEGPPGVLARYTALAVCRTLAPVERSGNRGSAITLLLQKQT